MSDWISVEDSLPDRTIRLAGFYPCLVCNDRDVQWALFNKKIGIFQDTKYTDISSKVTHWMPLPEPPNE